MNKTRFLSKSRFKLALECYNKLFYTKKKQSFTDKNEQDQFMMALAEGGFQVGELAKCYKPDGVDIKTLDEKLAISQTYEELQKKNAIIYEGAFLWNNCFVRADIIVKKDENIYLYEVKAKSYRGSSPEEMLNRSGSIKSEWESYIYDVAFQKLVIQNALPQFNVYAYLTLADKDAVCSVDGLNQKFFIEKVDDRKSIKTVGDVSPDALGDPILTDVNVDNIVDRIFSKSDKLKKPSTFEGNNISFPELVGFLANNYKEDTEIPMEISKACFECQFKDDNDFIRSGFHRCWKREKGFVDADFHKPLSFDLWGGGLGARSLKSEFIEQDKLFMNDIQETDFRPVKIKEAKKGMSKYQRRTHQLNFTKLNSAKPVVYVDDLKKEIVKWDFPLHFIDFETTALAIPMNRGLSPYEGVAFQFSHHLVDADGNISHAGQWINTERGKFPNFEFVRNLRNQLTQDKGTIFRYHNHENTYLNIIYGQLKKSNEKDKKELMKFIESIAKPTKENSDSWKTQGRAMVDMYQLVLSYYLHPLMKGSNSIKKVLPAVLNDSDFLQKKYSQPIYGSKISSKNFTNPKIWVEYDTNGRVKDPYTLLKPVFDEVSDDDLGRLVTNENSLMSDGGAAMMAYAKMQFSEMSDFERGEYRKALLRYCELDTLAMVMIYEHWKSLV